MSKNTQSVPNATTILKISVGENAHLLAWQNSTSPAVVVQGLFPPGTIADTPGQYGLANLTAAMLMTGTKNHNFQALHDKIESLGASINVSAGKLMNGFTLQCLTEDLPTIMALLTEIISLPAFPEKHFDRIKTQILTSIAIREQDTGDMANQSFNRALYGKHPFAHPSVGYAQDIAHFTLEDVRAFHHDYYSPNGMMIAAVGGLEPETIAQTIQNSLGQWQSTATKTQIDLPVFDAPEEALRDHIAMEEKSQTDLIIGVLGPKTMGEDFHACSLGNNILGQFGMMGRIGESVREKAGLAYYVQSSLGAGLGPTPWQVVAGVNPDNLDKAIGLIKEELHRFINEPVRQDELDDSRAQVIGQLPLALETNRGVAQALLSMERYQLGLDHLQTLPEKLAAVTAKDILDAAQKYWHLDKLVITSAGRALT